MGRWRGACREGGWVLFLRALAEESAIWRSNGARDYPKRSLCLPSRLLDEQVRAHICICGQEPRHRANDNDTQALVSDGQPSTRTTLSSMGLVLNGACPTRAAALPRAR